MLKFILGFLAGALFGIILSTIQDNQSLNAEYERNKKEREMKEEIERLNNIIKEAKEYIKKHSSYPKTDVFGIPKFLVFNGDIEKLLDILDKGE